MLNMAKHFQQVCHEMMDQLVHSLEQKFDSMKKLEVDTEGMKSDMRSFKTHQAECDHRNHDKSDLLKILYTKL